MENNLEVLVRTDDSSASAIKPDNSKRYKYSKRSINWICKTLTFETNTYLPEKTVEQIEAYLKAKDKMTRILYSEISNFLFNLSSEKRVIFLTNIEKLLLYTMDDAVELSDDAAKIVVKIYDHTQLVNYQIENMNAIFAQRITDAKIDLHKEIKGVEKEYISILGIFASIVLTFVGGISFSSAVLQNIGSVSIYRLLMVIIMLALVLVNVIYLLVKFIADINDKNIKVFKLGIFNMVCFVLMFIIVIAWILNVQEIENYLFEFLPWCK